MYLACLRHDDLHMDTQLPFCDECGTVGARLSGVHPNDAGLVRWTLYKCGHVNTEMHNSVDPSF